MIRSVLSVSEDKLESIENVPKLIHYMKKTFFEIYGDPYTF